MPAKFLEKFCASTARRGAGGSVPKTLTWTGVDRLLLLAFDPAAELDAAIAEAELAKRVAETQLAAAVAVVSARASFRDGGYRSIRTYLTGTLNCSGAQANKIRRRGDLVNNHEAFGDALLSGQIGVDQVDRLATAASHPRAGDQFADFVPILLEQAEQLEYNQFDKVIDHFIDRADPDGAFDTQKFHEDHRTASVRDDKGVVTVHASGGCPQAAAEMAKVFELAVQAEFEADCVARRAEHGNDALNHPLRWSTSCSTTSRPATRCSLTALLIHRISSDFPTKCSKLQHQTSRSTGAKPRLELR